MLKSNEQSLKEVINMFLKESHLSEKINEQKIISLWEKLMGKMIATHTKEISVSNKKLFLLLNSAPLKQELFYSREKIIQMLNKEMGDDVIQEIVFR